MFIKKCPVVKDGPMGIAPREGIRVMQEAGQIECIQMVLFLRWDDGKKMTVANPCDPGDVGEIGLTWCDDRKWDKYKHLQNAGDPCPGDGSPGDVYSFYYDERVCRTTQDALGQALAYTAYIELGATLVFIALFQTIGLTRSLNKNISMMQAAEGEKEADPVSLKKDIVALEAALDARLRALEKGEGAV